MEIITYTTPACPWCKKVKTWFRRRQIQFTDCDVYEENKCRDELLGKSNQLAVPVIDFDGEIIIGFDEKRLNELVQKARSKA